MKKSRELALQMLARIEASDAYTGILLDAELRISSLDARDKALVTELVYGVTRWRKTLDWYVAQVCKKPLRKAHPWLRHILRLGCYQLLFLDKIPASAAINESVNLAGTYGKKIGMPAQTAKGFVNATLRNLERRRATLRLPETLTDPVERLATAYSYPEWIVTRWIARFGQAGAERACQINNRPSPLIIRVNTVKTTRAELARSLESRVKSVIPLPGELPGLVLSGHPPVAELPEYQQGHFTVQNAASLVISLLLDPQPGETVLDACAGSGTKTSHLGELMQNQGKILAVDRHAGKLQKLRENCHRLGIRIVETHCDDVSQLSWHYFQAKQTVDRILVDAPCSGLGVLRKHPEAKWTTEDRLMLELQQVQVRLLSDVARVLHPGGVLVYSTCTTEPEENEQVVEKFLSLDRTYRIDSVSPYLPENLHPCVTQEGFLRIDPPQPYFDGFFGARLLKVS